MGFKNVSVIIRLMYWLLLEKMKFQLQTCVIYISFLPTVQNNEDCFHFE